MTKKEVNVCVFVLYYFFTMICLILSVKKLFWCKPFYRFIWKKKSEICIHLTNDNMQFVIRQRRKYKNFCLSVCVTNARARCDWNDVTWRSLYRKGNADRACAADGRLLSPNDRRTVRMRAGWRQFRWWCLDPRCLRSNMEVERRTTWSSGVVRTLPMSNCVCRDYTHAHIRL